MLVVLLFAGSASAILSLCPDIPPPPYIPKDPAEDIVTVTASVDQPHQAPSTAGGAAPVGHVLYLTVVFAAPTPPTGQIINILVTELQGNPPTEIAVACGYGRGSAKTTYDLTGICSSSTPNIAVYAWLGPAPGTDRAPNGGYYVADRMVRQFDDPEGAVGGVVLPTDKLDIVAPFAALAGLVVAVSAVLVVKKRKDQPTI